MARATKRKIRVLLIDEDKQEQLFISYHLSEVRSVSYHLLWSKGLDDALKKVERGECDVVLVDYHWGETNNNVIQRTRLANNRIPIIVMTGTLEDNVDRYAISQGASDYLAKDTLSPDLLSRTIRYAIERKKIEQRLDHLAHYDHLTDLPNRILFTDRLNQAVKLSQRSSQSFALMYIDLNGFKQVNDTYGHDAGDKLLQAFALRLQETFRMSDTVARIGGDEFTVLLNHIDSTIKVTSLAQKLVRNMKNPLIIGEQSLSVGCSIGIAMYPDSGEDAEELQRHADAAMYMAKQTGVSGYRFFSPNQNQNVLIEQLKPGGLQTFIDQQKITVGFTVYRNLTNQQIEAIEPCALWQGKSTNGAASFSTLLHDKESQQLLSEWWIKESLQKLKPIYKQQTLSLYFFLSLKQLQNKSLLKTLTDNAKRHNISLKDITVGLVDIDANIDNNRIKSIIDHIETTGINYCISNYGENSQSLRLLQKAHVTTVCIDESLTSLACKKDISSTELISDLAQIADKRHCKVMVKNNTTKPQKNILHRLGCNIVFEAHVSNISELQSTLSANKQLPIRFSSVKNIQLLK